MTNTNTRVVYLTGSTGFLGGMIVRHLQAESSVSKIYCPIRDKKGMLGPDRLKQTLGAYSKCTHIGIDETVPSDTTHVILNAYNTRFDEDLGDKLRENVTPILKIMDDLGRLETPIQGITLVSTAYVLPPLPFHCPDGGRIPFLLDAKQFNRSATQVYEEALKQNPKDLSEFLPGLHPYYQGNSYAFSKHILERLLIEKYPDLPVCVVRPSMIAPAQDLEYGLKTRSALPLMFHLAPYPVFMAPRCEGKVNMVPIEDVTQDCMEGAFELARPAKADESGTLWHPIIHSVSHSDVDVMTLFKAAIPYVPRLDIRTEWLRTMVRTMEISFISLAVGQQKAKLLQNAYETYDFFMANTWDFPPKYEKDIWKRGLVGARIVLERRRKTEKAIVIIEYFFIGLEKALLMATVSVLLVAAKYVLTAAGVLEW